MKLTFFLIMLIGTAHISLAEPEPYFKDLGMYDEEQSFQANQFRLEETLASDDNENLQSFPASSLNDIKDGKKWSEQSFVRAVKSLGVLNIPGLKLVKLPSSLIKLMKRMPNHTIVRPSRYVQPENKVQDDVPTQCIGVLQHMFHLAHADSRLAYQAQTLKCMGSCSSGKSCILLEKSVVVYLLDLNNRLVPKKVKVGCTCSCQ